MRNARRTASADGSRCNSRMGIRASRQYLESLTSQLAASTSVQAPLSPTSSAVDSCSGIGAVGAAVAAATSAPRVIPLSQLSTAGLLDKHLGSKRIQNQLDTHQAGFDEGVRHRARSAERLHVHLWAAPGHGMSSSQFAPVRPKSPQEQQGQSADREREPIAWRHPAGPCRHSTENARWSTCSQDDPSGIRQSVSAPAPPAARGTSAPSAHPTSNSVCRGAGAVSAAAAVAAVEAAAEAAAAAAARSNGPPAFSARTRAITPNGIGCSSQGRPAISSRHTGSYIAPGPASHLSTFEAPVLDPSDAASFAELGRKSPQPRDVAVPCYPTSAATDHPLPVAQHAFLTSDSFLNQGMASRRVPCGGSVTDQASTVGLGHLSRDTPRGEWWAQSGGAQAVEDIRSSYPPLVSVEHMHKQAHPNARTARLEPSAEVASNRAFTEPIAASTHNFGGGCAYSSERPMDFMWAK